MNSQNQNVLREKALELASKQRVISVAEFFEKNRHLLGFDNPRRALLTVVKEAVDNALDACEEAGILPEIIVEIHQLAEDRYRVIVEDNGPGIVKQQIPHIFARLLYGSKFHKLSQSRGQQGIGISAAVLYAQLTTGKATKITSKIASDKAHFYELMIDTAHNKPLITAENVVEWSKPHGTKIEMDIQASYMKGLQSVDEYLKQTAIVNPHATIIYLNPKQEQFIFQRVVEELPKPPKEIKPHILGVELGALMKMLQYSSQRTLKSFLTENFSRLGSNTAIEICKEAKIDYNVNPKTLTRDDCERILKAVKHVKIKAPPTDCLSPITAEQLEKGLRKEIDAEFFTAVSRQPSVYRGNPFIVEVAVAYGGNQPSDKQARLLRFANRVPLLYQQGACALTKAVISVNWKSYGLQQPSGSLPVGPLTIAVHIASVWVPFVSESKDAIASYPEIIQEVRLALQEVGRRLALYIRKKHRVKEELKKRSYIEKYIPHIAESIGEILELQPEQVQVLKQDLFEILEKTRKPVEELKQENPEFDEEFAKIGIEEPAKGEDHETS